jgi:hypothetical protein
MWENMVKERNSVKEEKEEESKEGVKKLPGTIQSPVGH